MKKIILSLLRVFEGKKSTQRFYERLYFSSLRGMNFGNNLNVSEKTGELFVINYLKKKILNKKPVLFDAGANIGEYSGYLARYFGKNADIYAFEPSKKTFDKLYENVAVNENVRFLNLGLSDKTGKMDLHSNSECSPLASVFKRDISFLQIEFKFVESVDMITVDEFCQKNNIPKIDFLKLDIEGNEYNALTGAKRMIANKAIDYIQFEIGGANIDSRFFLKDLYYLLIPSYRIYRILKNGIREIKQYEESWELFRGINYFAVSRNIAI